MTTTDLARIAFGLACAAVIIAAFAWYRAGTRDTDTPREQRRAEGTVLRCSFCGKARSRVRRLIAGPGVYICDECVDLCNEIIEEEHKPGEGPWRWRRADGRGLWRRVPATAGRPAGSD